ncbi:MAG: hypothetical protein ACRD1T_05020 [Acidimicrobiia bacterium]
MLIIETLFPTSVDSSLRILKNDMFDHSIAVCRKFESNRFDEGACRVSPFFGPGRWNLDADDGLLHDSPLH